MEKNLFSWEGLQREHLYRTLAAFLRGILTRAAHINVIFLSEIISQKWYHCQPTYPRGSLHNSINLFDCRWRCCPLTSIIWFSREFHLSPIGLLQENCAWKIFKVLLRDGSSCSLGSVISAICEQYLKSNFEIPANQNFPRLQGSSMSPRLRG